MAGRPRIRVESGRDWRDTKVSLVEPDGQGGETLREVPHVTKVELKIGVGEPNRIVLHALDVEGRADAVLDALKLTSVPPPASELHVQISKPTRRWLRSRSRLRIDRYELRGDGSWTMVTPLVDAWLPPAEPLELTVPE